jgi:RNA polymerase sigma factor (TIGR02999 family)
VSHGPNTTDLLLRLSQGDKDAAELLLPLVYDELHAIASGYMRHERRDHTLQTTALVNEAFLKLVDQTRVDWKNKAHFLAVVSTLIRRILIDHARKRATKKRGEGQQGVTLAESRDLAAMGRDPDLLDLDAALEELATIDERQARVVELRFFAGASVEETALVLDVSPRTVKGDWRVARAWLRRRLES